MTSGNLGMIACPILEDEMIYNLFNDSELGKVILLDNPHAKSTKSKLKKYGIVFEICSEDDFLSGKVKLPENGYNVAIWMMDMGLHEEPQNLRDFVKKCSMDIQDKVDAVILYYGLCGNGLNDVEKWKDDGLKIPITIIKDKDGCVCDDCISVAIGGTKQYLKLLKQHPGIMYFTPAYATNFDDMKQRLELFRGADVNDDGMMKMIFEMADYHFVMEIPTGLGDEKEFHESTKKFADRMGFDVMHLDKSWCTLEPVERSYAEAKCLLELT